MAQQLEEASLAEGVLREYLVQHAVEDARLDADCLAHAGRVVHHDRGEDRRDCEQRRVEPLFPRHAVASAVTRAECELGIPPALTM